jgi:hypothetical protein
MASARAVGSLRQSICQRLMHQRDIRLEPVELELRYADLTGDIFKAPNFTSSMQLIEEYRPEWRLRQYISLISSPFVPGSIQPFILRLSCHKVRPGGDFALNKGHPDRPLPAKVLTISTILLSWRWAKPKTPKNIILPYFSHLVFWFLTFTFLSVHSDEHALSIRF